MQNASPANAWLWAVARTLVATYLTPPTNFESQDYPRTAAARNCRIVHDIDEMYAKDENCMCAYRLKTAACIVLVSVLFLQTLTVSSPSLLGFIPLADGEQLEYEDWSATGDLRGKKRTIRNQGFLLKGLFYQLFLPAMYHSFKLELSVKMAAKKYHDVKRTLREKKFGAGVSELF